MTKIIQVVGKWSPEGDSGFLRRLNWPWWWCPPQGRSRAERGRGTRDRPGAATGQGTAQGKGRERHILRNKLCIPALGCWLHPETPQASRWGWLEEPRPPHFQPGELQPPFPWEMGSRALLTAPHQTIPPSATTTSRGHLTPTATTGVPNPIPACPTPGAAPSLPACLPGGLLVSRAVYLLIKDSD